MCKCNLTPPSIDAPPLSTFTPTQQWNAVIFGPENTPWEGGARPAGVFFFMTTPRDFATSPPPDDFLRLLLTTFLSSGTFKLTLKFEEDYPNKAPIVRFESKMFHPNSACPPPPPS